MRTGVLATAFLLTLAGSAMAADPLPATPGHDTPENWRQPVVPFQIADHTWYVGTQGLSALLVTTRDGAILIDGGLPQAAPLVLENLRSLGIDPAQVKRLLHSHAHADHAGPLAAFKRASGAMVVSNAESAALLARGGTDDLHYGDDLPFPPVLADRLLMDGESVELGSMLLRAHFTPAHTPGSMSWSWTDTRDGKPVRIAYLDSFSAPGYRLVDHPRYPHIVEDYRRGFASARQVPCDVLITPHPEFSGWQPQSGRQVEPVSCESYVAKMEQALERQLRQQQAKAAR